MLISGLVKLGLKGFLGAAAITSAGVATGVIPMDLVNRGVSMVENVLQAPEEPPRFALLTEKPDEKTTDEQASEVDENRVDPLATVEPEKEPEPSFDILRVEKDGSIVVAGHAGANSSVELLLPNGKVIGVGEAGPTGDFVIIPDDRLAPGNYSLLLRASNEDQQLLVSKEAGVVSIPEPGSDQVLAMVTRDGAASRIISKPEVLAPKVEKEAEPESRVIPKQAEKKQPEMVEVISQKTEPKVAEVAKTEITPTVQEKPAPVVEEQPVEVAMVHKKIEPAAKKTEIKQAVVSKQFHEPTLTSRGITVEAVEIEGSQVFVAGEAPKNLPVRVYIDNVPLGITRGTKDNRFLLNKKFDLKPGEHVVRADVLDTQSGEVSARAEVPLLHEILEPEIAIERDTPIEQVALVVDDLPTAALQKPQKTVVAKPSEKLAIGESSAEPTKQSTAVNQVPQNEGPVPIRTGSAVIIKPGDNLWRISRKTYGRGIRYTTIYNANRDQIRDPSRIYIGQIFKIPTEESLLQ